MLINRCIVFGHKWEIAFDIEFIKSENRLIHRSFRVCEVCGKWQTATGSISDMSWSNCEKPEHYTMLEETGKVRRT